MDLLASRQNNSEDILKGRFIRMKLSETAKDTQEASQKKMSGFRSEFWKERSFSVTDNEMQYEHLKVHRFIDMRTRANKDGSKHTKKSYGIHNRIIMGQYSQLTKELAFGFTDAVKEELRKLQDK